MSGMTPTSQRLQAEALRGRRFLGRPLADLIGLVARLVLGSVLLVAGALKVTKPLVSARAVQAYQLLPFDLAAYVGYVLPTLEIIVGLLLVLGLFTRISALLGTGLMVAFTVGIASAWARGLTIDCGCFGGGGVVDAQQTAYPLEIVRDLVFVALGAWLIRRPQSAFSLDARLEDSGSSRVQPAAEADSTAGGERGRA